MLPDWLEKLRRAEIVDRVRNDPRSAGGTTLGYDAEEATRDAAGWGQANFDEPWRDLSPDDRVLIYAYYFQPGHIEELLEAFGQLSGGSDPPDDPIVVDVGCGPFTGGLAVASHFRRDARIDYVGVDHSSAMLRFGEELATAADEADDAGERPRMHRRWAAGLASVAWPSAPGWRPVIVIVSYLLASPTLDVVALVSDLHGLLDKLSRGPATVLYTNSVRDDANRSFPTFRARLCERGFHPHRDEEGWFSVKRGRDVRPRRLRYALFHRPAQRILTLG